MLFFISMILAIAFVVLLNKPIKKYSNVFYIVSAVISFLVAMGWLNSENQFINSYMFSLFKRAAFSTGLWVIIMWAGALKNGSKPLKIIMPIRGELSIIASILSLGHNISFGKFYFKSLFISPQILNSYQLVAAVSSVILIIIMVPLAIISFPRIRKKMPAKKWKKYQRTAYIFYVVLYIHIFAILLASSQAGKSGYFLNIFLYSAVFLGYMVWRIRKYLLLRKKELNPSYVTAGALIVFVVCMSIACLWAYPKEKRVIKESNEIMLTMNGKSSGNDIDIV